jgi:hypothetical protein
MATVFILMLALSQPVRAQGVMIKGVKFGANFSNFHGDAVNPPDDTDGDSGWNNKIGACAGGFLTLKVGEIFAVQPEVFITTKGAQDEEEFQGQKFSAKITLTYLEISLLAKIIVPAQGNIKPNLFIGPALALKLNGKIKVTTPTISQDEDLEELKSNDFSLVAGAGLDFVLPGGDIFLMLEGRYVLGLTSIDDSADKADIKNKAFSLLLGVGF